MIPIGDDVPSRSVPLVTLGLIAANILVFLYELGLGQPALDMFILNHGVVPAQVTATLWQSRPTEILQRLFSSLFIHAGWLHLGGNMLYLWIFGDNVEDKLGHLRYLAFYILTGFAAMMAHVVSLPAASEPAVGASGAIASVLGAYLVMFPRARVFIVIPLFLFFPVVAIPAVFVLGFWFLEQLFNGTAAISGPAAQLNVAWWAHIGGFMAGMLLVRFFRKKESKKVLFARY